MSNLADSLVVDLHILQSHAPSNLNRDDLGSPKTANFGGHKRLRISSQCLKRSWRTSRHFAEEMAGHTGTRTRRFPQRVFELLQEEGVSEKKANSIAAEVVKLAAGGKKEPKEVKVLQTQLLFLSEHEQEALIQVSLQRASGEINAKDFRKALHDQLEGLQDAVDIAMFGRMITGEAFTSIEAAVQVAHALSTHTVDLEFDYFTAVDDLNPEEETGAGMVGELEFAGAVFYKYATISLGDLLGNLAGDQDLVVRAITTLIKAASFAIPSGKQNTFAAHNLPDYILVEFRDAVPVSYANAFLKPVTASRDHSLMDVSISELEKHIGQLDAAYRMPLLRLVLRTDGKDSGLESAQGCPNLEADLLPALETALREHLS